MRKLLLLLILLVSVNVALAQENGCCCNADLGAAQAATYLQSFECWNDFADFVIPTGEQVINQLSCEEICSSAISTVPTCGAPGFSPPVKNVRVYGEKGKDIMRIAWDIEDPNCAPQFAEVWRCDGSTTECRETDFRPLGVSDNPLFFQDKDQGEKPLLWNKVYTYRVIAHYPAGVKALAVTGSGSLGDLECMGVPTNDPFCLGDSHFSLPGIRNYLEKYGYAGVEPAAFKNDFDTTVNYAFAKKLDAVVSCGPTNVLTLSKKCQEGTQCLQQLGKPGACVIPKECEITASGLFGLRLTPEMCETRDGNPTYCFFDKGIASAEWCYRCDPSMVCYDYKNKDTCARDPCGSGSCEWTVVAGLESLGVGVCKDKRYSNCDWCGTSGSISAENNQSHNVIYNACVKEVATALSNEAAQCFVGEVNGTPSSRDCSGATCTFFDQAQCGSPAGGITLGPDNKITTKSVNPCSIPVCQWFGIELQSGARCRKNADARDNGGRLADCAPGIEGEACERDYFPPVTFMTAISKSGATDYLLIKIADKVAPDLPTDQLSTDQQLRDDFDCNATATFPGYYTWLCAAPIANSTYNPCADSRKRDAWVKTQSPVICVNDGKVRAGGLDLMTLNSGNYDLYYYTEDPAHNLEVVKKLGISMCTNCQGPKVNRINVTPGTLYDGTFYTRAGKDNPESEPLTVSASLDEPGQLVALRLGTAEAPVSTTVAPSQGYSTFFTFRPESPLSDGNYLLVFDAADAAGTRMIPPGGKAPIVVDTVKPEVSFVPGKGTVLAQQMANVTVSFNEVAFLTRLVLIEEVLTGFFFSPRETDISPSLPKPVLSHTVSVPFPLMSGRKIISVTAQDLAGNIAEEESEFYSAIGPPVVGLYNPRFGVAPALTFDVILQTSENCDCRYSHTPITGTFDNLLKPQITGGLRHTIKSFDKIKVDGGTAPLYVTCRDKEGKFGNNSFTLRVDTTPPVLTGAQANPNPVTQYPLKSTLSVQANEPVICKYRDLVDAKEIESDSQASLFKSEFPSFNISATITKSVEVNISDEVANTTKKQMFGIACWNEAMLGPVFKIVDVNVDFGLGLRITSKTSLAFSTSDVVIGVDTNKEATCYAGEDQQLFLSDQGGPRLVHRTNMPGLSSGPHSVTVLCRLPVVEGQPAQEASISVSFIVDTSPPEMTLVSDDSNMPDDRAHSYMTTMLLADWVGRDDESGVTAYYYTLTEQREGGQVVIDCGDEISLGPGCRILPPPAHPFWLNVDQDGQPLALVDGMIYVLKVKPRNLAGLLGEPMESDGVTIDTGAKPLHCGNSVLDERETDVDCGGECPPCNEESVCLIDSDCLSALCTDGICAAPSCSDGKIAPGYETDVDCGGSCDKCENGRACFKGSDCASGNCFNHVCSPVDSCSNGVHDGSEADVDCGGACAAKCGEGKQCITQDDCYNPLICGMGMCRTCSPGDTACGSPSDRDNDGVPDSKDRCLSTPQGAEVDEHGCSIGERSTCDDGITDDWRIRYGFVEGDNILCDGDAAADADPDNDGLTNSREYDFNTDPTRKDTDGDGWNDNDEIENDTDPNDPDSHPKSSWLFWLFMLFLIALLAVGGYYGYGYYQNHPDVFEKIFAKKKGPSVEELLTAARARVARQRAMAKKPDKKEEPSNEFVSVEELGKGKEFSQLEGIGKHEKKEIKPTDLPNEKPMKPTHEFERLKRIEESAPAPESRSESLSRLGEVAEGKDTSAVLESLSKVAFAKFSPAERREMLRLLKLLKLGKLTDEETEKLFRKLKITAAWYKKNKDKLEKELEKFGGKK